MALSEQFAELLGGIPAERERLEAKREEVMLEVAKIDEDLRKLRSVEKVITGQSGKPGPPLGSRNSRHGRSVRGGRVGDQVREAIMAFMRAQPRDQKLTRQDIAAGAGVSVSAAERGTKTLHAEGHLILAGTAPGTGARLYLLAGGEVSPPTTYGVGRSPAAIDKLKPQQREAELRRERIVQWAVRQDGRFDALTAAHELEEDEGRVVDDFRTLGDRGVFDRTDIEVWPEWRYANGEPKGRGTPLYELAIEIPEEELMAMNGAGARG